jgi:hypothetical protein
MSVRGRVGGRDAKKAGIWEGSGEGPKPRPVPCPVGATGPAHRDAFPAHPHDDPRVPLALPRGPHFDEATVFRIACSETPPSLAAFPWGD